MCFCTQVLKAKQGASQQYGSQAERDAHLKKHTKQLKQAAAGQQDQLQSLQQQEQQLGNALNDLASVSTACAWHTLCVFNGSVFAGLVAMPWRPWCLQRGSVLPAREFQYPLCILSRRPGNAG
jgi:hypothetical protein